MAYTGILLRGDSHPAIIADPPIHREITITDKGLVIGYDYGSGVVLKTLNLDVLAKIYPVAASGAVTSEVKTSDMKIVFDAVGDIKVEPGKLIVGGEAISTTLKFIKSVNATSIVFTDLGTPEVLTTLALADLARVVALSQADLDQITYTRNAPVITAANIDDIDITNVIGTVYVEDEAGTVLGSSGGDGNIAYSVQQANGARVYVYNQDVHKNKTNRASILIP